jgi:DHA2 family multidrug resistance protein
MLVRNNQVNHAEIAAHVSPFDRALHSGSAEHFWNLGRMASRQALDGEIGRQAALIAYLDDFKLMMFLALAAIPLVFILRLPRRMAVALAEPEAIG